MATFVNDGPTFLAAHGKVFFTWKGEDVVTINLENEEEKPWVDKIYEQIAMLEYKLWNTTHEKIKRDFNAYVREQERLGSEWYNNYYLDWVDKHAEWLKKFNQGKVKVKYLRKGPDGLRNTYEYSPKFPFLDPNWSNGSVGDRCPPAPRPEPKKELFKKPVNKIFGIDDLHLKAYFDSLNLKAVKRLDKEKGVLYLKSSNFANPTVI